MLRALADEERAGQVIRAALYEDDFELRSWRVRVTAAKEPGVSGFFARATRGDDNFIAGGSTREEAIAMAFNAIQSWDQGATE
jgi:hypothetical protein